MGRCPFRRWRGGGGSYRNRCEMGSGLRGWEPTDKSGQKWGWVPTTIYSASTLSLSFFYTHAHTHTQRNWGRWSDLCPHKWNQNVIILCFSLTETCRRWSHQSCKGGAGTGESKLEGWRARVTPLHPRKRKEASEAGEEWTKVTEGRSQAT